MDRLLNFDVRSFVQLLVGPPPRRAVVGVLWLGSGGRIVGRCVVGGLIVRRAAVFMKRAL